LESNAQYLVYQSYATKRDDVFAVLLTPVRLEWLLDLNPIYYYYLFNDKSNSIYHIVDNEDVEKSLRIILDAKRSYSSKSLIAYLDQIDNPVMSKLIMDSIRKIMAKS